LKEDKLRRHRSLG